jgi:hypothetical protein
MPNVTKGRVSRRAAVVAVLALLMTGCGGGGGRDVVTTTILSDISVDADVSLDLVSQVLSAPSLASVNGNVLAGVSPTTGTPATDTRGFLEFPLGPVPLGASIQFATVTIYLNHVTLADTTLRAPYFMDAIDTTAFPPPIVSSDYSSALVATRGFDFLNGDQGNYVEIEVTTLMQQAQLLGLPSFRVRIGFDETTFQSDLSTTRGLVEIDDRAAASQTAPLLRVDYF